LVAISFSPGSCNPSQAFLVLYFLQNPILDFSPGHSIDTNHCLQYPSSCHSCSHASQWTPCSRPPTRTTPPQLHGRTWTKDQNTTNGYSRSSYGVECCLVSKEMGIPFLGLHDRMSQTENDLFTVLKSGSLGPTCHRGWFFRSTGRENLFEAPPVTSGSLPAIFGPPWSIDTWLRSLPADSCSVLPVCSCLQISPFYKETVIFRLGATLL
jgi:hypothetical protein